MFTAAGDTRLTSGAKLWCCISASGEVIVSGGWDAACGGLLVEGGFSAQTKGESASTAPSPKPSAAARLLPTQSCRVLLPLVSVNCSSCRAGLLAPADQVQRRERIAREKWTAKVTTGFPGY